MTVFGRKASGRKDFVRKADFRQQDRVPIRFLTCPRPSCRVRGFPANAFLPQAVI
jgi:hypothetical protein